MLTVTNKPIPSSASTTQLPSSSSSKPAAKLQRSQTYPTSLAKSPTSVAIAAASPTASPSIKKKAPKLSRSMTTSRIAVQPTDPLGSATNVGPSAAGGVFLTSQDDDLNNTSSSFLRTKPSPSSATPSSLRRKILLRTCRRQLEVIQELENEVTRLKDRSRRELAMFKQTITEWAEIIHMRRASRRTS